MDKITVVLRAQAWERAKGELKSMLQTFYPDHKNTGQFDELSEAIEEFIVKIEDDGLAL